MCPQLLMTGAKEKQEMLDKQRAKLELEQGRAIKTSQPGHDSQPPTHSLSLRIHANDM